MNRASDSFAFPPEDGPNLAESAERITAATGAILAPVSPKREREARCMIHDAGTAGCLRAI